MRNTWVAPLGLLGLSQGAFSIDTVSTLNVTSYLGRWYQAYGNSFTAHTILAGATCVTADYGLDSVTGDVSVLNSDFKDSPSGELEQITGHAYTPDQSAPGKLKVHLNGVPFDGDYWIILLGNATYGDDNLYEYAVVTDRPGLSLFVLARDIEDFEQKHSRDVLDKLAELGFDNPFTKPVAIPQTGCQYPKPPEASQLVVVPAEEDSANAVTGDGSSWVQIASNALPANLRGKGAEALGPPPTVNKLDVEKYVGRWYQVFSDLVVEQTFEKDQVCVTADYALGENGTISVINSARKQSVEGDLVTVFGYGYVPDASEPGQLKVHLETMTTPFDAPYWVLLLGPDDFGDKNLYQWAVVSDPLKATLFVLTRDPEAFAKDYQDSVLKQLRALGFTSFLNRPRPTLQDGCKHDNATATVQVTPAVHKPCPFGPPPTVEALDVDKYLGRWYEVYSSYAVKATFEKDAVCVTADYSAGSNGTINVVNSDRKKCPHGPAENITGYAYVPDSDQPGKLKVHLGDMPFDAPYWVVALGPDTHGSEGLYEWAVVSDPLKVSLWILARDPVAFKEDGEQAALKTVHDLGYVMFYNKPLPTLQEGCGGNSTAAAKPEEDTMSSFAMLKNAAAALEEMILRPGL